MIDDIAKIAKGLSKPTQYRLSGGQRLTREQKDLAIRRSHPFLDRGAHLPLEHILAEVYIQGLRDAAALTEQNS